jgi:altronate dehydratase
MEQTIIINPKDNVAIALQDIKEGEKFSLADGKKITALNNIPYSHKVALADIKKGEQIIKYGETIGFASEDIKQGHWVHAHNLHVEEK